MKKEVYISETNCITPIGFDVVSNVKNILDGNSAIQKHDNKALLDFPFFAAIVDENKLDRAFANVTSVASYTKLEKMMILALQPIIENSGVKISHRTAFILSTTKGNITALENSEATTIESAQLSNLAKKIADFFGFKTEPIVVSNACVSGILAVSVAKRLIQANVYDEAFVVAGDLVSEFVLSGFNSFQAMSNAPCQPYSENRTGVNLGEATAAVLVTSNPKNAKVKILGDGSINDANHISGPSRTGEGLVLSIESALNESGIDKNNIGYISAHGTATPFNDEMEAIAINRLGLQNVPMNSLKGYYGHTLGASGLLETVIGIESILQNKLFASAGYDESGVSQAINVIEKNKDAEIQYFLKTASGFGGCNTAVIFEKVN
ncbi:beta-ketoacyl synthase [Flavobacterium noncentrifugens]|uniref:3-oxoacyl-[acyl-carrier-protein] synthase-1 n=1 Tax=Flavobacterium noncentrifugens TaxID=1128970 RepID=A0A1G8SCX9_9FLAO|nr:beta-ketoacyl synthase N-terminal-like domain-containing protein [Flavobacterium noncentrifugens]GEP49784.1 beta-ketoacyl synthase [Flavobacterium noncentrifugens]SDJ27116.1 3-oxoacyl-[acyl-carrier-protein] synthase-1 [Flavobacterium noncentrifugens]